MRRNMPAISFGTNAIRAIQGSPSISKLSEKHSIFAETNPVLLGRMQATVGAYQADE